MTSLLERLGMLKICIPRYKMNRSCLRESGQTNPKIIRHSDVIWGIFPLIQNFWMTLEWWDDSGWQGWNRQLPQFWPDIWDDRNDGNVFQMIKTSFHHHSCHSKIFSSPVISTPQMTMGWIEWHPNDWILPPWLMANEMTFKWWNVIQMMEWHSNDGMTFKWWNDIKMTKWHSNDGMTLKWKNDIQMTEWYWNDEMTFKWLYNIT